MDRQRSGTQIGVRLLHWAGGKRWFVCNHAALLPRKYNRYVAPFLGGASVFFNLQPERSLPGDINAALVATYTGTQEDWRKLERSLSKDGVVLDSDDFESVARLLKGADIRVSDFEALVDEAQKGDFRFADPPYTVLYNYDGFERSVRALRFPTFASSRLKK